MKVLVTTVPFAEDNIQLDELISQSSLNVDFNPYGRKMSYEELENILPNYEGVIAGTDKFDEKLLKKCKKLSFISRVGVGTDNIDHSYAEKKNIKIFSTPNEPSNAVAELTIAFSISLLRGISINNENMKQGNWKKEMGKSLSEVSYGIFGFGNIGRKVSDKLSNLGCKNILICDPFIKKNISKGIFMDKEKVLEKADIISLHLPLNDETKNFIGKSEFNTLKKGAYIINTARGDLINQDELIESLRNNKLGGAALDVYDKEPYSGELINLKNTITTSHIGPMTQETRKNMEIKAVKNILESYY